MEKIFGSFKDNHGNVLKLNDRILRGLTNTGYSNFKKLLSDKILEKSIYEKFLINTWDVNSELTELREKFNFEYYIEHEKIDFISYPYEWSFQQLKDAAIFHLNFQIFLLDRNYVLKDASAFNIQFEGSRPIFIDVTSIIPYQEGDVWNSHDQYCREFLNPLLLSSKKNVPFNNIYNGNLNGISTEELNNIFSIKDKLSLNIFLHIVLKSYFQKKEYNLDKINKISKKSISKKSYKNILLSLKSWIKKLQVNKKNFFSLWKNYSEKNTYLNFQEHEKKQIIKNFFKKNKINNCLDIGCNTGEYTFVALENGLNKGIGIDSDHISLNSAYSKAKKLKSNFTTLYIDLLNPSPNRGWILKERDSFIGRYKFDSIIALAVIHHICIGGNIKLDQAVDFLINIAPKGLIEFVPKNDYTVKKMLGLREDIFSDYSEENFMRCLEKSSNITNIFKIPESDRKVFEFKKKS